MQGSKGFTWKEEKSIIHEIHAIHINLYTLGPNEVLRRCVFEHEHQKIINEAQKGPIGGHY